MKFKIFFVLGLVLVFYAIGCVKATNKKKVPIEDQFKLKTESLILKTHGSPNETYLYEDRNKLLDEVRAPVAREAYRLNPNGDLRIKELVFVKDASTLFVWLVESNGEWDVIIDLEVPD